MSASAERYVKSDKRKVYLRTKNKYIDLLEHEEIFEMDTIKILYRCFKNNVIKQRTYSLAHVDNDTIKHYTVAEAIKRTISRDLQFFKDSQQYDSIHIIINGEVIKVVELK